MKSRLAMLSCLYVAVIAALLTVSVSQSRFLDLPKTSRLSGPAMQDMFLTEQFG